MNPVQQMLEIDRRLRGLLPMAPVQRPAPTNTPAEREVREVLRQCARTHVGRMATGR